VDRIAAKAWAGASRERHELVERNWKGLDLKRIKPELQPIAAYLAITPEAYYNPRYDARWLWKGVVVNPRLFEELFQRAFKDYEMFGDKKVVPVPTLAAVGRYDYIYPCSMWTNLGATPGLTVRVFEHSGHSPMVEESGEFERVLEAWLSR
jgi:proline iminopeptidase